MKEPVKRAFTSMELREQESALVSSRPTKTIKCMNNILVLLTICLFLSSLRENWLHLPINICLVFQEKQILERSGEKVLFENSNVIWLFKRCENKMSICDLREASWGTFGNEFFAKTNARSHFRRKSESLAVIGSFVGRSNVNGYSTIFRNIRWIFDAVFIPSFFWRIVWGWEIIITGIKWEE